MSSWLGVDVGWIYPAADSDGNVYPWTRRRKPEEPVAIAGPLRVISPTGKVRVEPALDQRGAAVALARATRDHEKVSALARTIIAVASKSDRGIALEDWSDFSRRKKAWLDVWWAIVRNAADRHVPTVQVNRAYTSLTCPRCHHKGRENRPTRDRFLCVKCGFEGQADVVAAMNIAARAEGTFEIASYQCYHCGEHGQWKVGLCLSCYHFKRREGHLPTEHNLEERRRYSDPEYRAIRARAAAVRRAENLQEDYHQRTVDAWRKADEEWKRTHDMFGRSLDGWDEFH